MQTRLVGGSGVLSGTQYGKPVSSSTGPMQGVRPFIGGSDEYTPPADERHCQWMFDGAQCQSWPVKNKDNPQRLCAGHMKKVAATDGPNASADQGLRSAAP